MAYVIQASALSKVFVREWEQKCVEKPEIVLDDSIPFEVRIPRSAGGIILHHNKPVLATSLLPHTGKRKVEEDEVRTLVPWLTGGPEGTLSEETDIYGVVELAIDTAIQQSVHEMLQIDMEALAAGDDDALKRLQKRQLEAQQATMSHMRKEVSKAREIANERVRRAMRATHSNLMQSWASLSTEGKGRYDPSATEAIGAFVLSKEIEKQTANRKSMNRLIMDSISTTAGV